MRSYSFWWRYLALSVALIYSQLATASWQAQNPNIFANHAAIGSSFSASGEWLFMGAANAAAGGKLYIFKYGADGYQYHSELSAPLSNNIDARQKFGFAVASTQIAGQSWLALSAPGWQINLTLANGKQLTSQQGRVYFYKLQHDSWQFVQFLDYPHDNVIDPQMGRNLLFADGQLLIGVANEGDFQKPMGRLLLAAANAANSKPWQLLLASGAPADESNKYNLGLSAPSKWRCDGDRFAYALAAYAGQIAVGAPQSTSNGCSVSDAGQQIGAVYIFKQSALGAEPERILSEQPLPAAQFGSGLAMNQRHLLIGAMYDRADGESSGAVYAYQQDSTGKWQARQKIAPQPSAKGIFFGKDMALLGDRLLISAARSAVKAYDPNIAAEVENVDVGAVYYFEFSDGKWQQRQYISAPQQLHSSQFFGSLLGWLPLTKTPLLGASSMHNEHSQVRGNAQIYVDRQLLTLTAINNSAQGALQQGQKFSLSLAVRNQESQPSSAQQLRISLPKELVLTSAPSAQSCKQQGLALVCAIDSMAAGQSTTYSFDFLVRFSQARQTAIELQIEQLPTSAPLDAASLVPKRIDLLFNSLPSIAAVGSSSRSLPYAQIQATQQLFKLQGTDALQQQLHCKLNNYQHIFSCQPLGKQQFAIVVDQPQYLAKMDKLAIYARLSNGFSSSAAQKFSLNIEHPSPTTPTPKSDPKVGAFGVNAYLCLLLGLLVGRRRELFKTYKKSANLP